MVNEEEIRLGISLKDNIAGNKDDFFIQSIMTYKSNLYRLAKSILKNEFDVEDAVGETILKAYQNLNKLRSHNKFKPWIMQILANECYRVFKLRSRVTYTDNMEPYTKVVYDNDGELWSLVNSLEEEFRAVVVLFYYEDMTIDDIAEILDLPLGTVKSRLSRARQKLKTYYEEKGGSFDD